MGAKGMLRCQGKKLCGRSYGRSLTPNLRIGTDEGTLKGWKQTDLLVSTTRPGWLTSGVTRLARKSSTLFSKPPAIPAWGFGRRVQEGEEACNAVVQDGKA
eukprot:2714254-Pyramimonas_sp.AAC.2